MSKEELYEDEIDRREYRRARRKRNQLIAIIVVVVVGLAIVVGGIFGVTRIMKTLNDKKHTEELQAQLEELAEAEPAVVEAPVEEEPEELTSDDYLNQIADTCISEMSLENKVAGLFMVTPEALTGVDTVIQAGDTTKQKLSEYPVGGLVYFSKNIQSADQLKEMLQTTSNTMIYPVFLAVDEEGGSVARVAGAGLADNVGDMSEIGSTCDPEKAKEVGTTIGTYLSELGFNVDFAPVADVASAEDAAIGKRSFGSDPNVVGTMVAAEVQGLQESGVSACLKHFPGIGDTTADTHEESVMSEKTLEDMQQTDLPAFQSGIDAGADFVMVSHISLPNVTGDETPSSLSGTIINDLLRNQLGYDGIVVTDALNMSAITDSYSSAEAAVKAIEAGADMLLMPENFEEAYQGLLEAVQNGTISEDRINESLKRIYRVKYRDRIE